MSHHVMQPGALASRQRCSRRAFGHPRISLPQGLRGRLGLLPDFVIVGVQRGGTSSLYKYLIDHPCVGAAAMKEVHFFDLCYEKGTDWYRAQFPSRLDRFMARRLRRAHVVTGEASPYYLFHPHAVRRIQTLLPQAKLIVLPRNPVDRAYSHYHHELKKGREPLPFEQAIDAEPARLAGELDRMMIDESYQSLVYQRCSYLARGRYVEQLERLEMYFPKAQILVVKSEDLFRHPDATFRRVTGFLGVPPVEPPSFAAFNVGRYTTMDSRLRARLVEYFQPLNERLYAHLDTDYEWD